MTTTHVSVGVDIDWSDVATKVREAAKLGRFSDELDHALKLAASMCGLQWQLRRGLLAQDEPTPVMGTPRVCIESPLRGDVGTNLLYADCCIFDSLVRDEAPFAGHLLYPRVLDDTQLYDRERGINAHLAWLRRCDMVAVYLDRGLSHGMAEAVELAQRLRIQVVERKLGADWGRMAQQLRATRGFGLIGVEVTEESI